MLLRDSIQRLLVRVDAGKLRYLTCWPELSLDLFPSSQICVAGESLSEKSEADLRRYRNETLGFVFQDFRLIEYLSLKDNILLPFTLSSRPVTTEINQRCDDLIQRIGLSTHGGRCVTQLSRGEQQRVAVCRAILGEPTLILADEPTANLDRDNAEVWGVTVRTCYRYERHDCSSDS